jgi:ABC-type phosphate transport system substrate-binding protein
MPVGGHAVRDRATDALRRSGDQNPSFRHRFPLYLVTIANAMTAFVRTFEQACRGQTLDRSRHGSGAGISEFEGNRTDFGGSDAPLDPERALRRPATPRLASVGPAGVFGPIAITYDVKGSLLAVNALT